METRLQLMCQFAWLKILHLQLCEVALRQQTLGEKRSEPLHLAGAQLLPGLVAQLRQVEPQRLLHHLLLLDDHHLLRRADVARLPAGLQLSRCQLALGAVNSTGPQRSQDCLPRSVARICFVRFSRCGLAIGMGLLGVLGLWGLFGLLCVLGLLGVWPRARQASGEDWWGPSPALTGVRGVTLCIVCKLD